MYGREESTYDLITSELADEIKEKYNRIRGIELSKFYKKRKKKQKAMQKDCLHSETFTVLDEDYHGNISRKETHCKQCGKRLSRV